MNLYTVFFEKYKNDPARRAVETVDVYACNEGEAEHNGREVMAKRGLKGYRITTTKLTESNVTPPADGQLEPTKPNLTPDFSALHLGRYQPEPHKPSQEILDLTNKFLKKLFDLYHKQDKGKRNDSYAFHVVLPDALVWSDYAQNVDQRERTLIGSNASIEGHLVEAIFKRNLVGITADIIFLIQNFTQQPEFEDWSARHLFTSKKTIEVEEVDVDVILGKVTNRPPVYKQGKEELRVMFDMVNTKSGKTQRVEVVFHDAEFQEVIVKLDRDTTVLTINNRDEPKIAHMRYIADINGFLHCLDQVLFMIREKVDGNLEVGD
jgi:hypothetical protein